uniref:Fatty acid-binding protein, heart-like n=1 Tax=Sinocyclocheilus grahami TaxID=75366 RepID=A0A672KDI8_SINGR
MVDKFVGTWKMTTSENFDEYMKALGVGFATRQVGNRTKPNLVVCVDDQGLICMKSQSTFKTTEIKCNLNESFEEITADDRKTTTVVTLENGKLVQKQTWDGKERERVRPRLLTNNMMMFSELSNMTHPKKHPRNP